MDAETINFIFTALVGLALIPIFFVGPIYLFERWLAYKRKQI